MNDNVKTGLLVAFSILTLVNTVMIFSDDDVSYDNTDQIEEFGVTLCYQWWESDVTVDGSARTTSDVNTPTVNA